MESKKIIFDVGANNGKHTLKYARQENSIVYSFEPTPELVEVLSEKCKNNSNIIIIEKAVSDFNGKATFNIAGQRDWGCSSLLEFQDNLNDTWKGRTDFVYTNSIEVDVIRLDKFMLDNDINKIDFLHCDAQGQDLNVLKGLGEFYKKLKGGVIETARDSNVALYKNQYLLDDCVEWLESHEFKIERVQPNDQYLNGRGNEVNVFFKNKNDI